MRRASAGFTLVELILVMAIMALLTAIVAPTLAHSLRGRALDEEAVRFLALTEYARGEAVSQGLPMVVWVDPDAGACGVEPKAGYAGAAGREREYRLQPDIRATLDSTSKTANNAHPVTAEFAPDGTLELAAAAAVQFADRSDAVVTVARTTDQWGYAIVRTPAK